MERTFAQSNVREAARLAERAPLENEKLCEDLSLARLPADQLENEKLCEELAGLPADQLAHIEKKGVKLRPAGRTTSRKAESFAASGLALLTSLHT